MFTFTYNESIKRRGYLEMTTSKNENDTKNDVNVNNTLGGSYQILFSLKGIYFCMSIVSFFINSVSRIEKGENTVFEILISESAD